MRFNYAIYGLLLGMLLMPSSSPSLQQAPAKPAVRPARLEALQNWETDAAKSGAPVFLPVEWGRLVSVQKTDPAGYCLFLENEGGEIHLVRLIQRGQYLYLDTSDQGGVALVIQRHP